MTTIEAAALRAIRPYYLEHQATRRWIDGANECACEACRHARYFAQMLGVDLAMPEGGA